MGKARKASCIIVGLMLLFPSISFSSGEYTYDEEDAYVNKAKLIDCQTISIDESFIEGKNNKKPKEITICIWKVKIGKEYFIMWKEINSIRYGFIK